MYSFSGLLTLVGTCHDGSRGGGSTNKLFVPDMPVAADGSFSYSGPIALGSVFSQGAIMLQGRFVSASKVMVDAFHVTGNDDMENGDRTRQPCPIDSGGPIAFELTRSVRRRV